MKKTTKYILITAAAAVVLGGALALLTFTAPADQESSESSSSGITVTPLLEKESNTLEKVEVSGGGAEAFTMLMDYTEDEEGKTVKNYSIEGYEDFSFNTSSLEAVERNFTTLNYSKLLGDAKELDLGEYGLEPGVTATATYQDGSQETFAVGNESAGTTGRYVLYQGKVYICSSISEAYFGEIKDKVAPASWNIQDLTDDTGNAYSYLTEFRLSGSNFMRPIEMIYNEEDFSYQLVEPVHSTGSSSFATKLIDGLKTFSASTVVKINPTQEELEEYGLTEPYAEVEFTINGESHTITVGAQSGNQRYLTTDGNSKVVYQVSASSLTLWSETTEERFRDGYVDVVPIMSVDQVTIDGGGNHLAIDLSRSVNEERTTDTQTVYDYTATRNGEEIIYENVTKFYYKLISLSILNMQEQAYGGDPLLTIKYEYYEGGPDTEIVFYQATEDPDRCIALIDGEYNATVRRSSVESLWKDIERFLELDPTVKISSF